MRMLTGLPVLADQDGEDGDALLALRGPRNSAMGGLRPLIRAAVADHDEPLDHVARFAV